MENELSWENNTLINVLIQGMEEARRLKEDLRTPYSIDTRDLQVQKILSSYEKALQILGMNESTSKSKTMNQAIILSPESPVSANGSPLSDDTHGAIQDHEEVKHNSKKRKITSKWTQQIRVSCEPSLEGAHEDGYNWRKYGQKDILGAKFPRSYYRCTFRNTQNCWATKQVQRSDEDPTVFDITYKGKHTCSQGSNAILPYASIDIQEKPHSHNNDIYHAMSSQESFTQFSNTLNAGMDKLGNDEMPYPFIFPSTSFGCTMQENHSLIPSAFENDSFLSSLFQTHLLAPTTPETNYFPSPAFHMNEFDGAYNNPRSESDITEILSTNTSVTNSPIPDFNFSIDPNFPFNTAGFFS